MYMSNKPAVSVIVPMYNTERFLRCCVDSLLKQTINDIEILLVDDGSPDACGEIAEQYARLDERVKVVHRENGGLGPARNSGLAIATGEYVGFVDSDDWVEEDMYERLYRAAKETQAQVVFSNLKRVVHGNSQKWSSHPFAGRTLCGDKEIFELRRSFYGALPNKLREDPVPVSACPNLYSRQLIEANGIRFRAIRSEDILFNTDICKVADCVAALDGAPYCYRKDDQDSITKTFRVSTIDSFFAFFETLLEECGNEPAIFRNECFKRADRRIIDYTRGILILIASASISDCEKRRLADEALDRQVFVSACKSFPFWRLPVKQAVFFVCMKYKMIGLALCLAKGRNGKHGA